MKDLPGVPIDPMQLHPRLRRMAYSLRESPEGDEVYVIFGGEEVAFSLPANLATVHAIDRFVQEDIEERLREAAPLNRLYARNGGGAR